MKKLLNSLLILITVLTLSSCATIFAGKSACHVKPDKKAGDPTRQIRIVPFVLDVFNGVIWLGIDFATGAIYQPCAKTDNKK
jgi:hypothetical protein